MSDGAGMDFLKEPPTEEELATLMWAVGVGRLSQKGISVLRRLAFHRDSLLTEVSRLKEGRLTPEEFHALCHNLHQRGTPCTREEFAQGCRDFQAKLFGLTE